MAADVTAAVPSFLGLTVTLQLRGRPVTVTAIDADLAAFAGASLELPLGPLARAAREFCGLLRRPAGRLSRPGR